MKYKEKDVTENALEESRSNTNGCCSSNVADQTPKCCEDMMSNCGNCMKAFRWFPLIPVAVGIILFLLGYFLDPEIVRVLWLIASGAVVFAGFVGLIIVGVLSRKWTGNKK